MADELAIKEARLTGLNAQLSLENEQGDDMANVEQNAETEEPSTRKPIFSDSNFIEHATEYNEGRRNGFTDDMISYDEDIAV